jgi:replicative DNA helicase
MVLFIYRPEYYKIDVDENGDSTAGVAEVSIAKNRNGPLKDVRLRFVSKYAKFVDAAMDYAPVSTIPSNASFDGSVRTRNIMSKMNDDEKRETPF